MHTQYDRRKAPRPAAARCARWKAWCVPAWLAFAAGTMTTAHAQSATQAPASSTADVSTSLSGLRFTPLAQLPSGPGDASDADACPGFALEPTSPAGKQVQKLGWPVIGEARLGRYQLVSFAGLFESGTSGSCTISRGNLAVFDGERLIALAYASKPTDTSIGHLEPIEGGDVRVWSGDYPSTPTGDLHLTEGDALRLGEIAADESLCHGAVHAPNIFNMRIDKARKALIAKGWQPVAGHFDQSSMYGRERGLQKRGLVEVQDCAGTGFGFCTFNYRSAGSVLSVVTVGDADDTGDGLPPVIRYDVKCH